MTDRTQGNDDQARYWSERAAGWIEVEDHTTTISEPFGRLALDALQLAAGEHVLDIGCGTGPTTVEIARRVGPDGAVLGVDIAPAMIDAARARAQRDGTDRVDFRVSDAQQDDLGPDTFDAAFSQFGVMFFADPTAAFRNIAGHLRDGGRLGFVCWQDLMLNEWMFVPGAAAVSVTGELPPMPGPGEPGPFSLSDPQHLSELLADAGFSRITVTPCEHQVLVPEDDLERAVRGAAGIGAVREALDAQSDEAVRVQILDAVRSALHERLEDGVVRLHAAAHLVIARR